MRRVDVERRDRANINAWVWTMKIDWLEGTILGKNIDSALRELRDLFRDWQELERGGYGYEFAAIVCGSGRVYWSRARPEMGVHISMPSSAIDVSGYSGESLLYILCNLGAKFTRVDIALDDMAGLLNLDTIGNAIDAAQYVSRFKKWTFIKNSEGGRTYSFGSRSSDSFVRIYDKAAEQKAIGHWIRVELELKRDRANAAADYILKNPDNWREKACGWLLGMIDFKIPSNDTNKSRWQSADWWHKFLQFVQKARIIVYRAERTVEDLRAWIESQVTPSLFVLLDVLGWEQVLRMIGEASARLKPKHLAMINLARDIGVLSSAVG